MGEEQTVNDPYGVPMGSVPRSPWGPLMHEEPTKEQMASEWGPPLTPEEMGTRLATREEKISNPGVYQVPANTKQIAGDHYTRMEVQPWTAMEAWMSPEQFKGFLRGNVVKYIARCDDKGGKEDLLKARHYLEKLLETYP